jgi:phage I-like protein
MPTAFAALSIALSPAAGREIQLTPAGLFKARDGRPAGIDGWKMDAAIAARVIARAAARKTPFVIDYEHQTLTAEKNGQPAPAAGWFKALEWRDGAGLYATDVEWTAKARAHIEAGEYKFISPVFGYDPKTGEVLRQEMAALTNTPALDGMDAVAALATEFFNRADDAHSQKGKSMNALTALLGLAEDANTEAVLSAVAALKSRADAQDTEIAALKTQTPDLAKYVPVETVTQLQTQIADLSTRLNQAELDDVIEVALSSGKLLPTMETWARELGKSNLAALKDYVAKNPAIAALSGNQTGGKAPDAIDPNLPVDERCKAEWQTQAALRTEFGDVEQYIAYTKATEAGLAKVHAPKE